MTIDTVTNLLNFIVSGIALLRDLFKPRQKQA